MLSRSARARPQSVGRILGRYRVDEEAAAPLEAGDPRELRNHLEMPVKRFQLRLAERRRVQHEVERRLAEHAVHPAKHLAEYRRRSAQLLFRRFFERGPMMRGTYPRLERKPRRERRQRREILGLDDQPPPAPPLLANHVTPDTALLQ